MVALLLFTGGGVFSIYEGLHKIEHPEALERVWLAILILCASLGLEGYATLSNIKEMNQRRGSDSLLRYLHQTKDSDLIVVFGENLAASVGLLFALSAIGLAWWTGDARWDGVGSLFVGIVLVIVALFLAVEVKSLLIGEAAAGRILSSVKEVLPRHANVERLLHALTLQQGPGQVLLLMKLAFRDELDVGTVADTINNIEDDIRSRAPEVRWCFIEPDRPRPETAK
jgi:divalent metal cation (Fe/Co/Zn/Cd) transporter